MIELKRHTVFPGQFIITSVPTLISTLLGSCVSVCLWNRVTKVGAMNHYLLPGTDEDNANDANRGLSSTRMLIRSLVNRKLQIGRFRGKGFRRMQFTYTLIMIVLRLVSVTLPWHLKY